METGPSGFIPDSIQPAEQGFSTICAWCNKPLPTQGPVKPGIIGISHGMCGDCERKQIQSYLLSRRPRISNPEVH